MTVPPKKEGKILMKKSGKSTPRPSAAQPATPSQTSRRNLDFEICKTLTEIAIAKAERESGVEIHFANGASKFDRQQLTLHLLAAQMIYREHPELVIASSNAEGV